MPENTFLKSISTVGGNKRLIEIKGNTTDFDAVTNMISCLEQSPFFGNVMEISVTSVEYAATGARESVIEKDTGRRGRRRKKEVKAEPREVSTGEIGRASIDFVLHVEVLSSKLLEEIAAGTRKGKKTKKSTRPRREPIGREVGPIR